MPISKEALAAYGTVLETFKKDIAHIFENYPGLAYNAEEIRNIFLVDKESMLPPFLQGLSKKQQQLLLIEVLNDLNAMKVLKRASYRGGVTYYILRD